MSLTDPIWFEMVVIAFSLAAGVLGAILGLGGGMIIVPVLTLFLGVKMKYAIGASIVSVMATSNGTAVPDRRNLTNLRLAVFLGAAACLGAWAGAILTSTIEQKFLYLTFLLVLLISIPSMGRELIPRGEDPGKRDPLGEKLKLNGVYLDTDRAEPIPYFVSHVFSGFFLMLGIGVLTGMLGIGCGALRVPVMDRAMRIPLKVSAATSNFMIGITSAVCATTLFFKGNIIPFLAAPVGLGVLAGARFGAHLLHYLPERLIRRVFLMVMVLILFQMGIRTWTLFTR